MRSTFPQLLLAHAARRPDAPAMREKEYGIWQTTSWAQMVALVQHIACGLHQAGLKRGEHLVVIGANRPRLYATMLALSGLPNVIAEWVKGDPAAQAFLFWSRLPIAEPGPKGILLRDQRFADSPARDNFTYLLNPR